MTEASSPVLSIVGSSNLSVRSVGRDVEFSFGLVSTNEDVRKQLAQELAAIQRDTAVPQALHMTLPARLIAKMFSSLF